MDVTALVRQAAPIKYPAAAKGYILGRAGHPGESVKAFSEQVDVILPEGSTERHYGPCPWLAGHGATLPTANAACVVVFDERNEPTVVWWEGTQTGVGRGTELPSSPLDGQEYDYVASAINGVVWRLRYRAASASTHKWEFVGGSDVVAYQEVNASGPAAPAAAFAWSVVTNTAAYETTLAGDYDVFVTQDGLAQNAETTDFRCAPVSYPSATLLATGLVEAGMTVAREGAAIVYAAVSNPSRCLNVAAKTIIVTGFAGSNPAAKLKFYGGILRVRPVRVG